MPSEVPAASLDQSGQTVEDQGTTLVAKQRRMATPGSPGIKEGLDEGVSSFLILTRDLDDLHGVVREKGGPTKAVTGFQASDDSARPSGAESLHAFARIP
jgi:hypothetical protein